MSDSIRVSHGQKGAAEVTKIDSNNPTALGAFILYRLSLGDSIHIGGSAGPKRFYKSDLEVKAMVDGQPIGCTPTV